MNKCIYLLICFALFSAPSFSQTANSIKGQVIDEVDGSPITDCSVFINSTSKGTATDKAGRFELSNIPDGKYELIISSIGYETYVQPFSGTQLPLVLTIKLKEKATDLGAVTVEPYDPDGWTDWGKTFIDNFLGTTVYARQCTIKNKEVIHFRHSSQKNLLTVVADSAIIIENKALGYNITYQLERFSADFNASTVVFTGYPLFSEMPSVSRSWVRSWKNNREKAYYGSVMHFIRSLYINQLRSPTDSTEGFDIRRQGRLLTAGDLVTVNADQTKSLFFTGDLSVTFRSKRRPGTGVQKSTIHLLTPAPVEIEVNGYYDSPLELFMLGYWSSQKNADLLPLDYWPEDK